MEKKGGYRFASPEWNYRNRGLIVAAVAVLVVGFFFWMARADPEERALLRMDADQRATLYEQTRATAASLCQRSRVDSAFHARCVDSVEFLRVFPECDQECRAFTDQYVDKPAR